MAWNETNIFTFAEFAQAAPADAVAIEWVFQCMREASPTYIDFLEKVYPRIHRILEGAKLKDSEVCVDLKYTPRQMTFAEWGAFVTWQYQFTDQFG